LKKQRSRRQKHGEAFADRISRSFLSCYLK
jgi:hypothetical protein